MRATGMRNRVTANAPKRRAFPHSGISGVDLECVAAAAQDGSDDGELCSANAASVSNSRASAISSALRNESAVDCAMARSFSACRR